MSHFDPNRAQPTELSPNPFEGMDEFASLEDLAIAEITQRILDLKQSADPAASALEGRLLGFQLVMVEHELYEQRQGYRSRVNSERSGWLRQEQGVLSGELDLDKRALAPGSVISDYGTAARWRLSQIDPTTLDSHTKSYFEARWSEASDATRRAQIEMLEAKILQLNVNAQLAEACGKDTAEFQAKREALLIERTKLNRLSYGAMIRSDYGTG